MPYRDAMGIDIDLLSPLNRQDLVVSLQVPNMTHACVATHEGQVVPLTII